jgi:hypothetical protein
LLNRARIRRDGMGAADFGGEQGARLEISDHEEPALSPWWD